MTDKADKPRIMMFAHSQFRGAYMAVASRLKSEFGAQIYLYVSTSQEEKHYRDRYGSEFKEIIVSNGLYEACRQPIDDEADIVKRAQAAEQEIGCTIGALSMSDRHLGRGFALAGIGHPRSRISEETSYWQLLNGYTQEIRFWRNEFDRIHPKLVMNPSKLVNVMCRKRQIPVRTLALSRNRNDYYWAANEFLEYPKGVLEAIELRDASEINPPENPMEAYSTFRKKFDNSINLIPTLKRSVRSVVQYMYWKIRGYEKARGYYLSENLRYLWRKRADARKMVERSLPLLADLRNERFVFFPLATEPELALQTLSPEYFFQLSCIASICRDLPAGYRLVVKEHHTAIGRRPRQFYEQIKEFKNTCIMNMHEPGYAVVKEACAVVTISGTAGFEAAMLGKPVIVFGRHNFYAELPHVQVITDEVQVRDAIHRALFDPLPEAKRDGQRFLGKLRSVSFEMGSFSPWEPDYVPEEAAANATLSLVEGCSEVFHGAGIRRG